MRFYFYGNTLSFVFKLRSGQAKNRKQVAELQKPQDFRSYTEIQQYIADTFGVKMKYKAVYALVHDKWNAKLKVPRKNQIKKRERG